VREAMKQWDRLSHLNLAAPLTAFPLTRLSGPGLRWEILCRDAHYTVRPDCLNPEQLSMEARELAGVGAVVEHAMKLRRMYGIEGVTFLGGEPFAQASALARAAAELRAGGLSVMCYSGHTAEDLLERITQPGKCCLSRPICSSKAPTGPTSPRGISCGAARGTNKSCCCRTATRRLSCPSGVCEISMPPESRAGGVRSLLRRHRASLV